MAKSNDSTVAPRGISAEDLDELTVGAIVTHQSPDWDAIGAVYFIQQLVGRNTPIVLVPAGTPASATPHAVAIVDTGKVYEPLTLRLDHHQNADNQTSATELAMNACIAAGLNPNGMVRAFVKTITAADLGKSHDGAKESRESGLHALLSAWKFRRMADEQLLWRGTGIMEALEDTELPSWICAQWPEDMAAYAAARVAAVEERARCQVYASADGKVVALDGASSLASQEAYANGAILVVFRNASTGAAGISRAGEATTPHIGQVLARIVDIATHDSAFANISALSREQFVANETADWFRHPAGFYAGLSPKADTVRPLGLPLATIAAAVDATWLR